MASHKSLFWDARAACGLCKLRAVVYCQNHVPGKAQAEGWLPGNGPTVGNLWVG